MAEANNKFPFRTSFGDADPTGMEAENDQAEDTASDGGGVPNVNQGEKTDMDMNLAPNKFPREHGHDTLTGDEVYLS